MRSESSEATEEIGRRIGKNLKGGEVIELISDLGGGKTTLVRGIAAGMGSEDRVSSPTFTVSKVYDANGKKLVHYDFYRLHDAGLMIHEISEELDNNDTVVIVEWADVVKNVLPVSRLRIMIKVIEDESRRLTFQYPEQSDYIFS